jgi:hypothetical protein
MFAERFNLIKKKTEQAFDVYWTTQYHQHDEYKDKLHDDILLLYRELFGLSKPQDIGNKMTELENMLLIHILMS